MLKNLLLIIKKNKDEYFEDYPSTKIEYRVLYFEIVDVEDDMF